MSKLVSMELSDDEFFALEVIIEGKARSLDDILEYVSARKYYVVLDKLRKGVVKK